MSLLPLTKVNQAELESLENKFDWEIIVDQEKYETAFSELKDFFEKGDPSHDREYLLPQFRWFTLLVWKRLNSYPIEIVLNTAIPRQIPVAFMLGFDVWREIIWFIAVKTDVSLPNDRESLYSRVRQAFLNSDAIIGEIDGKAYTVKDAVADIKYSDRANVTSIDLAQMTLKIKRAFIFKDATYAKFFSDNIDEVVDRFIGLVNFFLGIRPDLISTVIEALLHPKNDEKDPGLNSGPSKSTAQLKEKNGSSQKIVGSEQAVPQKLPTAQPAPKAQTVSKPITQAKPEPKKPMQDNPVKISSPTSDKPEEPVLPSRKDESVSAPKAFEHPLEAKPHPQGDEAPRRSQGVFLSDVKKQIETKFPKGNDGQFLNISEVLRELEKLGAKYNDDRIYDLYIFNEKTGKFEWNDALFK